MNYVVASNKIYMIGNQDGTFSPLGFHIEGEMSGIFAQPYKISKGYHLFYEGKELTATKYEFNNGESIFHYTTPQGNFKKIVNALDNKSIINMKFEADCDVTIFFQIKISIKGCWTAKEVGIEIEPNFQHTRIKLNLTKDTPNFINIVVDKSEDEDLPKVSINQVLSYEKLIDEQKQRRQQLLNHTSIKTNDAIFDQIFDGLKLNYDMLVQNIDNVGEGYTAGYPDFPWFFGCDTTYGSFGTLAVGQHDMTKQTLRLLKSLSEKENNNGRVIHEVSPFGLVWAKGNLQETPHFISAVYETYKWTGDKKFLKEMFNFCVYGMNWVESKIKEGSMCPKGSGIVEVPGIDGRLLDIAILTIDAYRNLELISTILKKPHLVKSYKKKRIKLENEVMDKFYSKEDKFFGDIICTKDEVEASRDILVNSIKNTPTLSNYLEEYFNKLLSKEYAPDELIPVVLKNWICILPYTQSFVPEDIKKIGIEQMKQSNFYNKYGMKLACLCDDKDDTTQDIYTLNKSMSINTGYLAKVFAQNGEIDRAYDLIKKLVECANIGMPCTISEILPDDGCFMQFWSGYGIHHVFLEDILGIKVDAPNKKVSVKPQLPTELNFVEIKGLIVGNCKYDITYTRKEKIEVSVSMSRPRYKFAIL